MATVTTSIGATGRDHSTVTLWEADLDDGGVYSSGDDAVGEMYDDAPFTDSEVVCNGGGTVGLNTATLTVASSSRHDGTAQSGAHWEASITGYNLDVSANRFRFSWLDLRNTDSQGGCIDLDGRTSYSVQVSNCILEGGGSNRACVFSNGSSDSYEMQNCIVLNSRDIRLVSGADARYRNVTVFNNSTYGFRAATAGSTADAYNCISVDNVNADYSNFDTTDYCISDDTTATGTGAITGETGADLFVATTSGSEDLHLKSGAAAIDAGDNLGATYEIDIDGVARTGTWDIGADQFVASGPSPLVADTGTFTLTGVATGLAASRTLSCDSASFSLNGVAADLQATSVLDATVASFALTGVDAGLTASRLLTCDVASFTLTGIDAALEAGISLNADTASFTLTGLDAGLTAARTLTCDTASFTLTGIAADLEAGITLAADPGSFTLTGTDTGLTASRTLACDTASFTLTGVAAGLETGFTLACDTASYSVTGIDASLLASRVIDPVTASFILSGVDATLRYDTPDNQAYLVSIRGDSIGVPRAVATVKQASATGSIETP